ncbi:MAG: AI-2E family transporter [bacterium]
MVEVTGIRKFFYSHWEKMVLWTILIGLFYLLRPFFLLIFETFLITFITKSTVDELGRRFDMNHRLATVLVFLVFVSVLGLACAWIGPRLIEESNQIIADLAVDGDQPSREKTNRFVESIVVRLAGTDKGQAFIGSARFATIMEALTKETTDFVKSALPNLLQNLIHIIKLGWEVMISLVMAIIFSFMLVMDWQRIVRNIRSLEASRIQTFYVGVAPHLQAFADVLGKALRAQAMIAAANTVLTAAGLWLFNVPNVALLSTIVFVCGFIPILGTFLSSIPILLFAIQAGGLALMGKLIILIGLVHTFEAYVLNPRITGSVLHMHPLMVLILLLIGERFFGIWGMVVGVPIGYYIITVLTMPDDSSDKEPGTGSVSMHECVDVHE